MGVVRREGNPLIETASMEELLGKRSCGASRFSGKRVGVRAAVGGVGSGGEEWPGVLGVDG